jgi:hypothetical protein
VTQGDAQASEQIDRDSALADVHRGRRHGIFQLGRGREVSMEDLGR